MCQKHFSERLPVFQRKAGFFLLHMKKLITFGSVGTFHEEAALAVVKENTPIEFCKTFEQLAVQIRKNEACTGLMAISNSTVGPIMSNYHHLLNNDLQVVKEVVLPVNHNVMVLPGVKLEDLEEIKSHPLALLQCANFLSRFPWIEGKSESTAFAAEMIRKDNLRKTAAIASRQAARHFRLEILAENIADDPTNNTHFLLLRSGAAGLGDGWGRRATVALQLDPESTAMQELKTYMQQTGVELELLRPLNEQEQDHWMIAVLSFTGPGQWFGILDELTVQSKALKVLGVYDREELPVKTNVDSLM